MRDDLVLSDLAFKWNCFINNLSPINISPDENSYRGINECDTYS